MSALKVISLGCRLNAYEGEAMRRLAGAAGLARATIINSCAVTNEAVRQTRQTIRRVRREDPAARVIVTGCAAQIDPAAFAAMPEVDAVLGNAEKLNPGDWRRLAEGGDAMLVDDIFAVRDAAPQLVEAYGDKARAFLQIQNGCDHRCTFCIIPYGRGASRSTPAEVVLDAARSLVARGHRELVLTGVDIASWGGDLHSNPKLGELVGRIVDGTPGLVRLRLSSIDSAEIDEALFERIAGDARVAPHLHLSLQSGDDMILKRMKRRHSRADALDLCERLGRRRDIAFGADLIAGFPTETEAMFENTLSLIDEAGLDYVHAFAFSPRAGTPAARMPQTPRDIVAARARRLREAGEKALTRHLDGLVGGTFEAIVEGGGLARLDNFASVRLTDAGAPGSALRVRILARDGAMLVAARQAPD